MTSQQIGEGRHCGTCRYSNIPAYEAPCCNCECGNGQIGTNHWVSKMDDNKGIELIYIGKIETHDECLLEILKDHGFYLHRKEMTGKFKDLEWYDILAKKEDIHECS